MTTSKLIYKAVPRLLALMAFVLYACAGAAAQSSPDVSVAVNAIPDRVRLGDEIRLFIRIERPADFFIKEPSDKIALTPFEIKKVERLEPVIGVNRARETLILTLTVFELGDLRIPPVPVEFLDGQKRFGTILTQSVPVKVIGVARRQEDAGDMRPIKDPFSFDLSWIRFYASWIAALMLMGLLVWVILRGARRPGVDPELFKPAHERALLELSRLRNKNWLNQNMAKEHYSELTDILRRYLERRYQIPALEKTTGEIYQSLRQLSVDDGAVMALRQVFENADLVKFADQVPPYETARQLEAILTEFIQKTRPVAEVQTERAKT